MSQDTEPERYRSLDISQGEVRLLSFETSPASGPLRLRLHYASLKDWKPEYVSFRNQKLSTLKSTEISEAWADRFEFTPETPSHQIFENTARFTWGDYICLSYTWGDPTEEKATVFLNDVAMAVQKNLEKALRDLRGCIECRLGMKVWVDALCINQADVADRNAHVLRVKDIFGMSFAVSSWVKNRDFDSGFRSLNAPGEYLLLCEVIAREHGQRTLEEVFGIRKCEWGADEEEDDRLMRLAEGVDVPVFDQYRWVDSDDEDDFGVDGQHLRDLTSVELSMLLREDYWSRLWIIQELAVSPTTSMIRWGDTILHLSTVQAVATILLAHLESRRASDSPLWQKSDPGLDLLRFTSTWTSEFTLGNTENPSTNTSLQSLNDLTRRMRCSLPQDKVYSVLGLFPASTASALRIDYNREPTDVIAEFSSIVPQWEAN